MKYALQCQKLCLAETARRLVFVMGMVAIFIVMLQTLTLPFRNHLPSGKFSLHGKISLPAGDSFLYKPTTVGNIQFYSSVDMEMVGRTEGSDFMEEETESNSEREGNKRDLTEMANEEERDGPENVFRLDTEQNQDNEFSYEEVVDLNRSSITENIEVPNDGRSIREKYLSLVSNQTREMFVRHDKPVVKKMRCNMPPKTVMTISEMNQLLLRKRASSPKMKPQWPSIRDQELVSAKSQIINAPVIRNSRELYAPLFRNVSMFKRSYELMERILKVYVYKEGEQPIFHQPILKGIYASEGWFMKLMEGNQNFVVKDPRKAHMFYMPFSTRMIQQSLYVHNSHNRTNLALYLKNYANMIAAKYPFWNRTIGADHFFVGCHDWAPYETRHHMERCVKALCNADVTVGYKIGKDVSVPQTYVRSDRNLLRDVGGKSPSERWILAFFAGNLHGYLRRILLKHWENKDPEMKIFGRMPSVVARNMSYIQHMKSSKYCICAKGYEVNSPRIVEAIFYECVPVIISDNFVPPFFDVLNWEAFAVFVAEKDIPKLKEILLSIPHEKYLAMQMGVKKVQQHFLWHRKPVKYDLFHMTLHSIWYNRLFQIKPR